MPQLIIGLDSLGDDANYIHIDDAKEDSDYYCPCCKGLIKPRAYKKDEDYQVQPHFYHVSGGCKEESFVHYICKEWLFVPGCKFIVNGITYEVDSSETEKTLHTSFGDYRPDIIVTTTSGKIFYFEIRVTNRKTELYAPKWDELGNDVVEVDTRYFINQKYNNSIPTFDLIYSEGKCYIKSYTRKDYDHLIGTRKVEWKRQSKLDYKIQWGRLDWFWNALSEYKKDESKKDSVIESFGAMDITDRIWCYQNIKGKSCVDIKQELAENINQYYFSIVLNLFHDNKFNITIDHVSPLIYEIDTNLQFTYKDYTLYHFNSYKVRLTQKLFLPDVNFLTDELTRLNKEYNVMNSWLMSIQSFCDIPYVEDIRPKSHLACNMHDINNVHFVVYYKDYIHNKHIPETIGSKYYTINEISKHRLYEDYQKIRKSALDNLNKEIIKSVSERHSKFQEYLALVREQCANDNDDLFVYLRASERRILIMLNKNYLMDDSVISLYFTEYDDLNLVGEKMYDYIVSVIERKNQLLNFVRDIVSKINSCGNSIWHADLFKNKLDISIKADGHFMHSYIFFSLLKDSINDVYSEINKKMNEIASGLYGGIRLLEVDDSIE